MRVAARNPFNLVLIAWSIVLLLALGGCSSILRGGAGKTEFSSSHGPEGKVTQAELQDDLLRFESQFNARIQDANYKLETSPNPDIRYRAELNRIVYYTNSLGIALGPSPESNLLDMVSFIELSRDVYDRYWLPRLFGHEGEALSQAFKDSVEQIWVIASKVLSPSQKQTLQNVISEWREKHPNQIDVETIRLSAYSTEAGAKAAGLSTDVGGLFSSVQQSTQSVDSARLFAERALYYAQRIPFLLRYNSKLATHEILKETALALGQADGLFSHKQDAMELLGEIQKTLLSTQATFAGMDTTLHSVENLQLDQYKHPKETAQTQDILTKLSALLRDWNRAVESPSSQNSVSQMAGAVAQAQQETDSILNRLTWRIAALIAFFWVMALFSRLAYHYLSARLITDSRRASKDNQSGKAA
ncbi:MAG: hypothetical protein ACJ763_08435 [Bdellovibrionia bacterium]